MESIGAFEIVIGVIGRFWPVWLAIAAVMGLSWIYHPKLGFYGRIYGSPLGIAGLFIVLFWLFTAIFADVVATFNPLEQFAALKNKGPGTIEPGTGLVEYFGGDKFGRDVFSRMVYGSQIVLVIAPRGDGLRADGRHHARLAGGLLWGSDR